MNFILGLLAFLGILYWLCESTNVQGWRLVAVLSLRLLVVTLLLAVLWFCMYLALIAMAPWLLIYVIAKAAVGSP